jgi:hypothetical protein
MLSQCVRSDGGIGAVLVDAEDLVRCDDGRDVVEVVEVDRHGLRGRGVNAIRDGDLQCERRGRFEI